MCSTYTNFVVCNGKHEAGFNQFREVFSRDYNPTVSDFENWLPSLTFLCQGKENNLKSLKGQLHMSVLKYNAFCRIVCQTIAQLALKRTAL